MAQYALIGGGSVVQLAADPFAVHAALTWVEVDSYATPPGVGWSAVQAGNSWTFTAPPVPQFTLAQQALLLLGQGVPIASTSTPTLDATYPCDPVTQAKITAIQLRLASNLGFPGGLTALPWKDSSGNWHELTTDQFTALGAAISNYVAALDLCIDGAPGASLPAPPAPIA